MSYRKRLDNAFDNAPVLPLYFNTKYVFFSDCHRDFPYESQMQNRSDNITIGRIVNIDRQNRSFTVMTDRNVSSAIRFNVPPNARILDLFGRSIHFHDLIPGLRVRVRHASFMTMSLPPQTTAFTVRVIR